MNTHEQFIELPTAKLAKQAGFYWECNERYNGKYATNDSEPLYVSSRDNWNQYAGLYSAPTQSVLQRWLRDVKNIQVWSEFHNQIAKIKSGWIVCFGFFSDNFVEVDYLSGYRTYEAALEAGLQKCLTLLIEKQ